MNEISRVLIAARKLTDEADFMVVKGEYGPSVVMGNVRYPLNVNQLQNIKSDVARMGHVRWLVLRVPICDIRVTAGREEIQYNKEGTHIQKALT